MGLETIIFIIVGAVAIAAAAGMLLSPNAVHSALFLILNLACVAFFYLALNAPFMAMVQITVYAGAIMVLFLFVIMLLGAERLRAPENRLRWQAPVAFVLTAIFLVTAVVAIVTGNIPMPGTIDDVESTAHGGPAQIGETLFTTYLLPFEMVSVLLLAAMIGAVVLTRDELRRERRVRRGQDQQARARQMDTLGD
jgi:NADH-quinone oxidoreductase subunit J